MPKLISALCAVITLLAISSCSNDDSKDEPLPVGYEWIDPIFAQVLQERGYIADSKTVTPLDVADLEKIDVSATYDNRGPITYVKGLEYFKSLKVFRCDYNQLTSLDISNNQNLTIFDCRYNPGVNNKFIVTSWFDSSSVPADFSKESWNYNGNIVTIEYRKP